MNLAKFTLLLFSVIASASKQEVCNEIKSANNCISFTVSGGTGCAWMCEYCANNLGSTNYYFTDGVCSYEAGGCVGNPVAGKTYTCCSA